MFQMSPFYSVILPVYNSEAFIKNAVESIMLQTFEDFELIIINDGSTDGTKLILENIKDERIKLVHQENKGLVDSLNHGLQIAKGNYIARMDADDYSYPQRLARQYEFIKQNPSIVLFSNYFNVIDENNNFIATRRLPLEDRFIREVINKWNPFCHPSAVFKRELALKVGGYPKKKYQEDWELWKELIEFGSVGNIPEILLDYRVVTGSESALKIIDMSKQKHNYLQELRIGICYLEFALNTKKARKRIKNSLIQKITLSGVYNYLLTFFPSFLIKLIKNASKGKYYIS